MPIIVGNQQDLHVQAVVCVMRCTPTVIDAAEILHRHVTVTREAITVDGTPVPFGPGWLRRLAPDGWVETVNRDGVDGVSRAAAVSALAAIARDERFKWLTPLDALGGSENKPFQYRRAQAAGVPVPEWMVTTDPGAVPGDGDWVAKPLGPGAFVDEAGQGRVVPTRAVETHDREVIARVPFVLQRRVEPSTHARVVTVGDHVWSATLPAEGLPLDWRTSRQAHHDFTAIPAPESVHMLARAAATAASVSYSAQDWILDKSDDWWFVDLNPAGQWLFLPPSVADPITKAIARHLDGAQ